MQNKDLAEYYEWEKKRNSWLTNLAKTFTPIHLIVLVLLIVLGIYLITSKPGNKNYIIAAIVGIVIIAIISSRRAVQKELIPEHIIKIIAANYMERKIQKEYPLGTIISPMIYCKLQWMGEWGQPFQPWKWNVGFKIIKPSRGQEQVRVLMHPYEGFITGIVKEPAGYTGQDLNDLKVLFPQVKIEEGQSKGAPSTGGKGE